MVDTRLRQHLSNLYKAEKDVSSADDVSDTEKLLAVMHSKNVNFTQEAIKIIIHLMALEENQQAIGRSVLILELIRSLSAPQDAIRTYAAWALSNFSSNESNHKAIHEVGGIKALLSLLTSSSEDSLKQALSALLNISSNPMFVETIRKSGGMREMIRLLEYSGNAADAIIPLTLMVFINLATNEKNMEMFGDVGGFPPLIKLLHHPVFSMDAMPFLIALLNNPRRVSQFIAAEGLRPLFDFVSRAPARQEGKYDNSLEHCLLALHHLLSNEDYVRMIGERNFVLPLTALLDGRQDPRILVLVVEIIDTLLDSDERNGTQLVTAAGIERLVALLPAKRPKRTLTVVVDNALLLLTGLLETNDNNQEHLLDRGVVPAVAGVMSWATNETLEHALHLIALLTSGVNGQVVYDEIVKPWPQVLPRLLQMLNADPANKRAAPVPDSTRIKIALCFSALLGHIDCHMDLVELEVVGHFIDLLASPNQRLQFYAITALRNLSTYYASVRREIQHLDGLGELLALVHGPNRAAVSVARLEAMRTIANLSVTDDPIDLQEFCDTSVPVLLAVLATPPPSRDDITRAVAKRKQRLSSGSQQDPNCNKITSLEMQQVREPRKGRDGSTISTPPPHDLGSSHIGGGNAGNAGNSGTMLVRAARLTGANSSLNTNGRGSRVSNMESLGSGDLETRIGNVGTVGISGSGGSRIIAVNSGASIGGLGSQDDQEEDRMLEERVFQTKWENDCLIKAYTAITLQNLSIEADFVDVVHSAGGLGVVMEYLLGSSSPRLQYEAVRLLTVWAAQDANRMAFQEMGGIQRLEQALASFQSSPVPNDALIMCTQIALNTMSIPPVELSERMMSLDDDDDSGIIGWEPETAILDYMRQVEHAIRAIELSNPLESYHSHSLPTSPKDSVTKSSRYSSQPVTLRRSVRQRERFDKYQRGGIKDASIFAQPSAVDEVADKDQTAAAKVVGWREEVGISRLLESSGPAAVPPSRLLFDQMEEMRDRMTGKPGVGDLTSLAPLSPSRGSRSRGSRAAERREKNEDGKASKSEAAAAKKNEDESAIGETEAKAPKRRGSFRQLSKQFSATLKKVHQTTKKAKTDADKGNGDDKDNKKEKEKKKKKKKRSDKEKEKSTKKKEKEKEKSTKRKKKKAAKQKSSGVRGKPDGLGDGKEAYKWSVEEVGDWLEENSLGELRPVFAQHHIDGKALMQLHHAALSRMGIFSQPLSSALLQRRRKLLTRSTSLTAPPSDSSMGSSLSSSRSYPNLSSSSSSSVSVHARDKIVKDEEKRKHKKKSKDKAKAKEESGDKTEKAKTKPKPKAKAKKSEGEKGEGEGAGHEQKQEKRRKKGSSKQKRRKTAGNDGAAEGEEGSTTTTTEAERESKVVPRKGSGDVDKKKPAAASTKPKVSSLRRRPTELSEDGKGKEKAGEDVAGGNGGRRKELRFEGNVLDEDEESELGGTLIDDLGKGKGEELLVLRDIRISLQEERELKSAAAGTASEGGSEHRGSGRKRGGSSTRRRKQRGRQLAAAAVAGEETDEDHPEQQAKSPRASAGAAPRAADPKAQPKQAGFLRSISTIFHIRGNKHTAKQHDPHHLDAASSQHSTASSAVDEVGDGAAAQSAAHAGGEEKKRGSWVRSAFLRRGRKGDGGGEERKNAIRRGSEEEAELRNSKETARRQQKEQKQEQERKKKQEKEKAKERNKLSRKNSSLLSRMAVSTKRGNQGSKKTMTFSLEEDVNYGSTTDTTTTHSHSRGRGDEGDLQDEDDEDEMDNIRRKQGTPRVNLQRATSGDELLLPLDGEGSIDHASYSETEEQEVADYSEVVHQTTMDSGSYPSTPKRGSTARPPTRQQLFSLTTARLQVITQLGPHRKRLMLDLLETERRYVALVTVLIRQFLKPLLLLTYTEQEQFLTEEELHSIFLNIGLLHSYNLIFLSNLTQRVHSWSDSQPVADVFLMLSDFLTAYGEYLHNYEAATALLQHCLQDPSFDQFVKTLAASPDCEGLGLEDFLILPYQRITAYAHIFRKLVKWTWESHADYGDITTVLHTVEKIISSNVHLRLLPSPHEKGQASPSTPRSRYTKLSAREGFLKLLAVHDILLGCPIDITITPGRQYVCEAQVTLLDEAVNRQRGWLYLFNDALLTTTEIEIAIRKTFPLQNKDAQDFCSFIPLEDIMTIDEAREYSTIVKVTCKGGRIITIKFDSTESKSLWLDHFVVIVAAHRQKTARYNPPDGVDHLPPHYAPVPHGLASEESEFES